ncbi:phosphoribosyl-AMP cyclohydrolase [Pseudomonas antarctica]|jgi:phosphoribosyl-AMP cyclohydrolase|uniref:Phosphoribosyl-AMP cyclohydrolase n=1 Tax=Pseudomonas antarctica TaxID=219572 RepID=A0A172Z9G3_9PSED|nr:MULTISPECIES: phosphoribosyl-AMP cyclohydrolase [Pseudomonas]ANF89157.1 phosphoribosyl-AMP cyclohydrolase [Pseudomonas antarctica]MBX7279171.1 phosphoribosyl-AMP cyclohydrolase [Pseudomonas sp. ERGC3:01]QZC95406.1 phosphoribosyl-AMP cyclohydrolase [Pseudomonas sp. ERGC3:05]UXV19759.1 phosphoribosyl-AMP cyclohydrolase [Pseudomonas fluorescens]
MTLSMLDLEGAAIGSRFPLEQVLNALPWNSDGLIAAIVQQHGSGQVLMLAWMNRKALDETLATRRACYWSRSRQQLWRKGESSGHWQQLVEARLDCDGDAVLMIVDQHGPACHTGRPTCFYNAIDGAYVHIITEPAA